MQAHSFFPPFAKKFLVKVLRKKLNPLRNYFSRELLHGLKILGCRLLNEEAAKQGLEQQGHLTKIF
jgi:hypothetical protein